MVYVWSPVPLPPECWDECLSKHVYLTDIFLHSHNPVTGLKMNKSYLAGYNGTHSHFQLVRRLKVEDH